MFTSILRKWENTNPKYMFDLNVPENCLKICQIKKYIQQNTYETYTNS